MAGDPLSPAPPLGEEAFDAADAIDSEDAEVAEPTEPALPVADETAPPVLNDDSLAAPQAAPSSDAEPTQPAPATGSDWSNFEPAPGYVDRETGRPVFREGTIDQAGMELMLLVEGQRPVFKPEKTAPGDAQGPPPPPDFLAGSFPESGQPPRRSDRGPAPSVSVDIRVTLSDEEMERVSKDSIRRAAEFSRAELMIVARKLYELDNELYAKEHQRQILARQY